MERPRAPILLSVLALAASARALELDWQAPPECPSAQEIEAQVTRIVGASPHAQRPVTVFATAHHDRKWTLVLRTRSGDEEGERTLEGGSCQEVAKAAVLVIALTIDPEVLAPPTSSTPVASASVSSPPPLPSAPTRSPVRGVVRVGGGVAIGSVPGVGGVLTASVGLQVASRVGFDAGLLYVSETSQTVTGSSTTGGRFSLVAVPLRACAAPLISSRFALFACAGGEAQWMHATGYGVSDPKTADVVWGALRFDLEGVWLLSDWLHVFASLAGLIPFARPRFVLQNVGEVYELPPFAFRPTAGVEVLF